MLRIDSHQHFWKYNTEDFGWITDDMSVIRKDFSPADLEPILKEHGFDGCVSVQVNQIEDENNYMLSLAEKNDFIKGIVGWVDLQAENVEERLAHFQQYEKLKGFRHILQGEKQRDLMLTPAFKKGIGLLSKYGFTYDVLIFPDQLAYTKDLLKEFPDQKFVIDHVAKPYIKKGEIDRWKKDTEAVAMHENVFCKISGMVTEADWKGWKKEDFTPYLDVVVNAFGTKRIMYGSDWPVCLVAASYKDMLAIVQDYFASFSKDEQDLFFGGNACTFYQLK